MSRTLGWCLAVAVGMAALPVWASVVARPTLQAAGPMAPAQAAAPAQATAPTPEAAPTSIVLDQTTCVTEGGGTVAVDGATWKAQTFVPGVGGRLRRVALRGVNQGATATLHVRAVDSGGGPLGADMAALSVDCGLVFDFGADGPRLEADRVYVLAVSKPGAVGAFGWRYSNSATCYPDVRGRPWTSVDRGVTWSADIVDFLFTTWMVADSPGGTPAGPLEPPCTPPPTSGAPVTRRTTFVISLPTGRSDPAHVERLTRGVIDLFRRATMYHARLDPAARPYIEFGVYGDTVFVEAEMPRRNGGIYDLGQLYAKYGLCDLVRGGAVDEVWVWEGGQGGLPEYAVAGPEWSAATNTRVPDCGRQVTTMVFNNTRELDVAMESLGHRLEATFMHYFPCEFWTRTWPWQGWPPACRNQVSDRTGFVARPFAGNNDVGACGDIHHPPNILDDRSYDYRDPAVTRSICEDWQRDGTARVGEVSCETWGCSHFGYMVWWMQNLPGYQNTNRDAAGRRQPNWWDYVFGTRAGIPTPLPAPSTMPPTAVLTPAPPTLPPTAVLTPASPSPATPTIPPTAVPTPGRPSPTVADRAGTAFVPWALR